MAHRMQAHLQVSSFQTWLREVIEAALPWFDPKDEQRRDDRTEDIRKRSIAGRIRAERIIAEYRDATVVANRAGEAVINEIGRDAQ